jgi:hypothetical protein
MYETNEEEVQNTSCQGSGDVLQLQKSPKMGGRGLIGVFQQSLYT